MVADLSRRVTGWWILPGLCEPGEAANVQATLRVRVCSELLLRVLSQWEISGICLLSCDPSESLPGH